MRIQEVCDLLNLTKKAIYYYEKQSLIKIKKDSHGYRIFNEEDIERLHEISFYRKLNIEMKDIKLLLNNQSDKKKILSHIYEIKQREHVLQENTLNYLKELIEGQDIDYQLLNQQVDYQSIAQAIREQIPGLFQEIFIQHFLPYLQITIQTNQQKEAYKRVIEFWDNLDLKIPLSVRLLYRLQKKHHHTYLNIWKEMDRKKEERLNDEDVYEQTKNLMENAYQLSRTLKYRIISYPQRKMKIKLQDVGYNDILIPAMCILSPAYNDYYTKLKKLNDRVCLELGLYYDAKMKLQKK